MKRARVYDYDFGQINCSKNVTRHLAVDWKICADDT